MDTEFMLGLFVDDLLRPPTSYPFVQLNTFVTQDSSGQASGQPGSPLETLPAPPPESLPPLPLLDPLEALPLPVQLTTRLAQLPVVESTYHRTRQYVQQQAAYRHHLGAIPPPFLDERNLQIPSQPCYPLLQPSPEQYLELPTDQYLEPPTQQYLQPQQNLVPPPLVTRPIDDNHQSGKTGVSSQQGDDNSSQERDVKYREGHMDHHQPNFFGHKSIPQALVFHEPAKNVLDKDLYDAYSVSVFGEHVYMDPTRVYLPSVLFDLDSHIPHEPPLWTYNSALRMLAHLRHRLRDDPLTYPIKDSLARAARILRKSTNQEKIKRAKAVIAAWKGRKAYGRWGRRRLRGLEAERQLWIDADKIYWDAFKRSPEWRRAAVDDLRNALAKVNVPEAHGGETSDYEAQKKSGDDGDDDDDDDEISVEDYH